MKFKHYNYFKGMMKEMAIFDRELKTSEMKTFLDATKSMQGEGGTTTTTGGGVTGGAINNNCNVTLPPVNGTAQTISGPYCYNGVHTGPDHGSAYSSLKGAGQALKCTVKDIFFKYGLQYNGSQAGNSGFGPHASVTPPEKQLWDALNITSRFQYASLSGIMNLLAHAKNADGLPYYLGPSSWTPTRAANNPSGQPQRLNQIIFQNESSDSCKNQDKQE
jgi:hypothetical protein